MIYVGTRRVFRLREVIPLDEVGKRAAQTFDIPLPHNSVGLPQSVRLVSRSRACLSFSFA